MSYRIEIDSADGRIDAHVFTPADAPGALPAVILLTDIGGLRPCYHEKAQIVADGGYAVLLPNVYYRHGHGAVVPEGKSFRDEDVRPTLFEYAAQLTPAAQRQDFAAWLSAVDDAPEFDSATVGVVGYCMTGAFALRMAAWHPERITAAAGFHAANLAKADDPDSPIHDVESIQAQLYFGHADGDTLLPPDQIARLDQALAEAGVHFCTELYKGAGHGYTAKDAPVYDARADARHFKRLLTLFEECLGTTA